MNVALSDYEKQILAEMEQHLRQQDPDLADAMSKAAPPPETSAPSKPTLSPRRIAIGSILAAAGLAILLTGVTIGFSIMSVVLGAVGFLLMVGGVLYALSTDSKKAKRKDASGSGSQKPSRPAGVSREQQRRKRWEDRR